MRIVHLSAEFAPIAKAGGLGEVVLGLSRMQTRKGHSVEIIIPKYDFINASSLRNLAIEEPNFKCLEYNNAMWECRLEECSLHLLEARHPAGFFHRGKIYNCEDDPLRFLYFSRAALEYLLVKDTSIDILHLHDWHASIAALLVKDFFQNLKVKAIVLTIHNVEYQGKCSPRDLDAIGLIGQSYLTEEKLQDPKQPDLINLLKSGIIYSDSIVPVSPSYAKEILTPEFGFELEAVLKKNRKKIRGILNGIDMTLWNPAKDTHLDYHYEVESVAKAKKYYKQKFSQLNFNKKPWVGAITRLVPQKGPKLLEAAIGKTIELGGCFLLLGSSPSPHIQAHFRLLQEKYKNHPQVFLHCEYNEKLAHEIYAALDFLLVPSLFEPCGLTQLIAMRYGTIPIVRATGGLQDTVFDCENYKLPIEKRNGFLFKEFTKESMSEALERAFRTFHNEPETIRTLIRKGMGSDFSWKNPTEEYLSLYRSLLSKSSLDVNPIGINVVNN